MSATVSSQIPIESRSWLFQNVGFFGGETFSDSNPDYHEMIEQLVSIGNEGGSLLGAFHLSLSPENGLHLQFKTQFGEEATHDFDCKILLNCYLRSVGNKHPHFVCLSDKMESSSQEVKRYYYKFRSEHASSRFVWLVATCREHISKKIPLPISATLFEFLYDFYLMLDVQEFDGSKFSSVLKLKDKKMKLFRLRAKATKKFLVGIVNKIPDSGFIPMQPEKCVGIFICYGRYRKSSELVSLELNPTIFSKEQSNSLLQGANFASMADWPPDDLQLAVFNEISNKDSYIFFTIRLHFLFDCVPKPVKLQLNACAKIFDSEEGFSNLFSPERRPLAIPVQISLSDIVDSSTGLINVDAFNVTSIKYPNTSSVGVDFALFESLEGESEESGDADKVSMSEQDSASVNDEDEFEQPVTSGQGQVEKDISSDQLLNAWSSLMPEWQQALKSQDKYSKIELEMRKSTGNLLTSKLSSVVVHPMNQGPYLDYVGERLMRKIRALVQDGVPETLRAEVWTLLSCPTGEHAKKMEAYRIFLPKPCDHDTTILKDLNRTYPATVFFQRKEGQDALFHVNHAYALYDEDLGYCQGVSFIAAALLLHLPEEQAFSVLVDIMFRYNYRSLFTNQMEGLRLLLYQLDSLLYDRLPSLSRHLTNLGIESHMYASQWVLTLFTAKFPLPLVYHILDLFMLEGRVIIFKVYLTLLEASEGDLKGQNFEDCLRFFSQGIPKRYQDQSQADNLAKAIVSTKISLKKLDKYAKNYEELAKRQRRAQVMQDPLLKLESEKLTLVSTIDELKREKETFNRTILEKQEVLNNELEAPDPFKKLKLYMDRKLTSQSAVVQILNNDLREKSEECAQWQDEVHKLKDLLRDLSQENENIKQWAHSNMDVLRDLAKRLTLEWTIVQDDNRNPASPVPANCDNQACSAFLLPESFVKALAASEEGRKLMLKHLPDWERFLERDSPVNGKTLDLLDNNLAKRDKIAFLELELASVKLKLAEERTAKSELQNAHQQMQQQHAAMVSQLEQAQGQVAQMRAKLAGNSSTTSNASGWLTRTLNNLRMNDQPVSDLGQQQLPRSNSFATASAQNESRDGVHNSRGPLSLG